MGFLNKNSKSIESLEEEAERLDSELSVAEKRALLRELESKFGKGAWKWFSRGKESNSSNSSGGGEKKGFRSGIAWDEIKFKLNR